MLATYAAKVERWGWRWRLSGPEKTSAVLTHFGCVLDATMNAVDLQACLTLLIKHCAAQADVCGLSACFQPPGQQIIVPISQSICTGSYLFLPNRQSLKHRCCTWPMVRSCHNSAVQVYLHQLGDTHGSAVLPPAVIRILNAKACRSAIMFGDPLLPTECAQLVALLKLTQLCFSCAHGRPTMAPLVDLQAFCNQVSMKGTAGLAAKPANDVRVGLQCRLRKLLQS